ncbi:MAG: ATP-binding cassette domain-containing protein [Culicoidibacterales bacterium]
MKNQIKLTDICFSYDDKVIFENFNLTLNKGEHIAIVGANGSGKTTLSRIISGILLPKRGEVSVDNATFSSENMHDIYKARQKTSVVLQNPEDQFVGSTVAEDIAFGLENKCIPSEEMQAIIDDVAQKTSVSAFLHKQPHQLSGGQKQRVAIASCLALETEYMIFDEATSQLDPQGKRVVLEAITKLAEMEAKTIIMITHDLAEVQKAQRVIVLYEGEIAVDTTPNDLFSGKYALEQYHLVLPKMMQYSQQLRQEGLLARNHVTIEGIVEELSEEMVEKL